MDLRDYLYIDQVRLDSYAEQIGEPATEKKRPEWKAEIGLTGPKITATQQTVSRPMTTNEKIERLLAHLTEIGAVANGSREYIASYARKYTKQPAVFVHETCDATRVRIPAREHLADVSRDLVVWVATYKRELNSAAGEPVLVCLLQDLRDADEDVYDGGRDSAYTVLESLFFAVRREFSESVLSDALVSEDGSRATLTDDRLDAWLGAAELAAPFVQDPLATFEALGCRPSMPRNIEVLYRIREVGPEFGSYAAEAPTGGYPPVSIFGYPIFIAAG